jgi:hypothetical protein
MTKSIAPPTLEEVDARLAKIEEELKRFETLTQEKQAWMNYRYSLLRVTKQEAPAIPTNGTKPAGTGTMDYAERILTGKASMHLNDMVATARKMGWEGSGDDKTDRDRVYSAMHRRPDKFEMVAPQTWKLKS